VVPAVGPSTRPSSQPSAPATQPTPDASAQPAASFRTYTVKSGDTLGAIASKLGTTVSALVALNHLSDARRLSIGQVLRIP
jgi:LysM repeat protein